MLTKEEFDRLEPTDQVVIHKRGDRSVAYVVRKTATRVIVRVGGRESSYMHHGEEVGGETWSRGSMSIPEDGEVQAIRDENKRKACSKKLHDTKWGTLPLETLVRVLDIIEPELAKLGDAK